MKKKTFAGHVSSFFRIINSVIIVLVALAGGFLAGTYREVQQALPEPEKLAAYSPRLTTKIYSTELQPNGEEKHELLGRVYKEDREPEELRNIPEYLSQATIAIEDRPFYRHRGIDPKGIMRAAWVNLQQGGIRQGGSTITQQLARNMWLSQERSISRKLKEILLALELERRFSKDEILEMYLNEVFYGHGAYGVRRAAGLYFDKPVSELSLAQCAMIAGLPRSPLAYSPYSHPQTTRARRRQVLIAMRDEGFITPEQYKEADGEQIQSALAPLRERGVTTFKAPYFTHYAVRQLCDQYGVKAIYEGGLEIYTTLDMRAQRIAEEELTRGVEQLRQSRNVRRGLTGQGALACVAVQTGDVLAMVGGVGPYEKVQYNRAHPGPPLYGRQSGSSFKPYVWAVALENGYGPNSVFSGSPLTVPNPGGKPWTPKNYSPRQGGNYTLRHALAESVNLVSVRVVQKLGTDLCQQKTAEMLNIPPERIRPFLSLSLGVNELSPLEQAVGYSTFASGGLRPKVNFIRRIVDPRGEILLDYRPQQVRVLRAETANSMISMLQTVVLSGTGRRAAVSGVPVGGKTGTTNAGRDVWWVGITPSLSAAVWVGNDDNSPMPRGSGGGFCAPIWARFIKRTTEELQLKGEFPKGAGAVASRRSEPEKPKETTPATDDSTMTITVCSETGRLATPYCPATVERTVKASERPGRCRKHGPAATRDTTTRPSPSSTSSSGDSSEGQVTVTVCSRSGQRAGAACPQTVERTYPRGQAPSGTCTTCGKASGGESAAD
jgi:penicillin-binding protein 1A